jgi:hypothetical protein
VFSQSKPLGQSSFPLTHRTLHTPVEMHWLPTQSLGCMQAEPTAPGVGSG